MLSGEKILVTGAAGIVGFPLAAYLARDNDVWGLARFTDKNAPAPLKTAGVVCYPCDIATGQFSGLPEDFTYVLHLAALSFGDDSDRAVTVNAEGTGLLLQHCRRAKAALVMSTHSVYKPQEDPYHRFVESDPLGINAGAAPGYSVSKIAQEGVARFCARQLDLPVVIARLNVAYGPNGGLPVRHLEAVAAGQPVITKWDPCPYSLIYEDDINEQAPALLGAASVPAAIINWAGDEVVSVQEWTAYIGQLVDREPRVEVRAIPGAQLGQVADVTRRRSITGPCRVGWQEGLRRIRAAHYHRLPLANDRRGRSSGE
jgi:nucleoside-diphosphate-sugar epimerase